MKGILYGGEEESLREEATTPRGGKKVQHQRSYKSPYATWEGEGVNKEAQGHGEKSAHRPGDKGNKFATGASKVGSDPIDNSQYEENYWTAQKTRSSGRDRHLMGSDAGILSHEQS